MSKLNVGSSNDADGFDNIIGMLLETLLKLRVYGQHRSGTIRISRMHAHSINILYKAHCDHLILRISNNLKLQLFPSEDRFLDKDLPDKTKRKSSADDSTEFLDIINQTTACSAHCISRAYNTGQADILKRFFSFLKTICNLTSRHLDTELIHCILECLAVFSPLDGVNLNAYNLDAVFF